MFKIGFVGMTHLGIVSSVACAEKGFKVTCFDPDTNLIKDLTQKIININEPNLNDLLDNVQHSINFTSDISNLNKCKIIYLSVDVSTNYKGESDLSYLDELLDLISKNCHKNITIVILSQVPPGYTRSKLHLFNKIYYQVETLIFGEAVNRARNPERLILGSSNLDEKLPIDLDIYLKSYNCSLIIMDLESAELTKISINICLVASISVANTISELCEKIGANWSQIAPALKLDKRIGNFSYLNPGLGIGGGNLQRDLITYKNLGVKFNSNTQIIDAFLDNSNHRREWVLDTLKIEKKLDLNTSSIAILGLSYKKNTISIKNSPSIYLINSLGSRKIHVYDPVVKQEHYNNKNIKFFNSALDACDGCEVLIIMTPWEEFVSIDINKLKLLLKGDLIIDPYKALSKNLFLNSGFRYKTLGI